MNFSRESGNPARFYAAPLFIATFLFCAWISPVFGQERSTYRDNPTAVNAKVITDDLDGSDTAYFYKFTAGPGKLTVTIEVKASGTNAGAMLDLFDANSRPLLSDVLAQGIDGGSERIVNSVQLSGKRNIVMRIKGLKYGDTGGTGTYKITLDGPVVVPQAADAPAAAPAPAPANPDPAPAPAPAGNNAPPAVNGGAAAPATSSVWSGQLDPTDERLLFRNVRVSGAGQVTFSFNVKAIDAQAAAKFAVVDEKGTQPLDGIVLQGGEGISKPVTFAKAQTLLIMVAVNKGAGNVGRGSYSVQVSGPAQFDGASPNGPNPLSGQLDPANSRPSFHLVNVNNPGQVSITFSVKAANANAAANFAISSMYGRIVLPALEVKGGESITKAFTLDKVQTLTILVMAVKPPDNGKAPLTYSIQVTGPVTVIR